MKKTRLKQLCRNRHISQEKLAEDLEVDPRTVRRWMNSIPSRADIIILADYFNIEPYELFGEYYEAIMPEFKIANSGAIDYKKIKHEVTTSLIILSEGKGLIDIYRNIYVEYTEEMMNDLLDISLDITNLYSRIVYTLSSKEWRKLLGSKVPKYDANHFPNLRSFAIDLFNPMQGFLNNTEITNTMNRMYSLCNKYKYNPLYELTLATTIETLLIDFYLSSNKTPTSTVHQSVVCKQIFLELLSQIGDIRPHKKVQRMYY